MLKRKSGTARDSGDGPAFGKESHDIDRWELYDLKNDPQQLNNIYEKPEAAKILPELKAELHRLQVLYDDPIRDL